MNSDNTFTLSITGQIVEGGTTAIATVSTTGTWSQNGNQITFNSDGNTITTGLQSLMSAQSKSGTLVQGRQWAWWRSLSRSASFAAARTNARSRISPVTVRIVL